MVLDTDNGCRRRWPLRFASVVLVSLHSTVEESALGHATINPSCSAGMRAIMPDVMNQSVEVLWSRTLHINSYAMAVSSGSVVVAERHSRLVRLDPSSGEKLWDQHVEDCWGTTVIADGFCLYLSQAGVLHCFDLETGRPLWAKPDLRLRYHVSVSGAVIFLGGWRGYHALTRLSLPDGQPLPFDGAALSETGPLAVPLPLRLGPNADSEIHAVLIAGTGRAALLLMAASGVVLDQWTLPEPMVPPDSGGGYQVSDNGDVTFLSGRRTVMTFHPDRGVQVLWQHERDLIPWGPMLDDRTLWLVDDSGIAVIALDTGVVGTVDHRKKHGYVCAGTLVSGNALFAFADGSLVRLDRAGNGGALMRVSGRIDRLSTGEDGLVHALGKGHLVTFRFHTGDYKSL